MESVREVFVCCWEGFEGLRGVLPKRLKSTSLLERLRGDISAGSLLRPACSMSHCMRSFDLSSSLLVCSVSPLALASCIVFTRLATSGSNMFTILLRQYQVGKLKMGMIRP